MSDSFVKNVFVVFEPCSKRYPIAVGGTLAQAKIAAEKRTMVPWAKCEELGFTVIRYKMQSLITSDDGKETER